MWSLMRTQTYSTIDCYEKCIRKKRFKCNKTQKIFGSMVLPLCFKVVYSKWNDFNFFETYESTAHLCRPHHASEWHAIDFKHPSFLRKMFKQTWIHRWCHDKNVLLRFGFENDYFCDGMIFFVLVSHIRVHLHNNCSIFFRKNKMHQCLWPPQSLWCWCGPRVWRTPCQWSASTIGKFSKFVSCFGRKRCFSACCWHTWSQNHHQFQYSNEFIVAAMRKALPTPRW